MMKNLSILLLASFLLSCQTTEEEKSENESGSNSPELISLNDHFLFACEYVYTKGLDNIKLDQVESDFGLEGNLADSIILEHCVLKRSLYFDQERLVAIKYSTFTDSLGMVSSTEELESIKSAISTLLINSSFHNTLYSYEWINQEISYQIKIYPKEGIDLVIAEAANAGNTDCVGDLYAAQNYIGGVIQQKLENNISLDSLDTKIFNGITISSGQDQILMAYSCKISQKLKMLDTKSIEKHLNNLLGSKPELKDGMRFWTISGGELQMDEMSQGYSFKFIQ